MNAVTRTLGQAVAAAAVAVALLLGAMEAQGADAAPIKDTRPMADKVRSLKENCENETGGTFTDRPSATDDGKTITNCSGGGLATVSCVLTATTSECMTVREKPPVGGVDPIDVTDLGPTNTPAPAVDNTTTPDANPSVAAPDDHQDQDTGKSKSKKGKKGGKGRKK